MTRTSVLVTGACGGGVGSAIVNGLIEAGYEVFAHSRTLVQFETAVAEGLLSSGAHPWVVDLGNTAELILRAGELTQGMPKSWAYIGNASTSPPNRDVTEETVECWLEDFSVNVLANFVIIKHLLPSMQAVGRGRILLISSSAARRGAWGRPASYSASKAALMGLSNQLAVRYARKGITSNVIVPGQILTQRSLGCRRRNITDVEEWADKVLPLGRAAVPGDLLGVVMFLMSPAADYITGQEFHLEGGRDLSWPPNPA